MTLLTPLGLLGLLGIIVWILIYIIKPNYQQKMVSSTYVWKLSLKYRKKKLPSSTLKNILLLLCQLLILVSCALILSRPAIQLKADINNPEIIVVIDSSASMRAQTDGETRFERAVNMALKKAESTFSQNGIVSVILADDKPSYLEKRTYAEKKESVFQNMKKLLDEGTACSYGSSDIEAALSMSEEVITENSKAQVYLYTDTDYYNVPQGIHLVNVNLAEEWNAGILNAYAKMEENYCVFYVDVACSNSEDTVSELTVTVEVYGVNATDRNCLYETMTSFDKNGQKTIVFKYFAEEDPPIPDPASATEYHSIPNADKVFSYESVHISLTLPEADSFPDDDTLEIFGGTKEVVRIQYASALRNDFFGGILSLYEKIYVDQWDIRVTDVKPGTEPAMTGYDLYIFEHKMPEELPKDGVVFLVNPDKAPMGAGFRVNGIKELRQNVFLTEGEAHPLMAEVKAHNITVSTYTRLSGLDAGYKILMNCTGEPVLLAKNEGASKVVVMPFSLHYSNLPILEDFPSFMLNFFDYFIPSTVLGNSFEVNRTISLNARGESLTVFGPSDDRGTEYKSFPVSFTTSMPGTYRLEQTTFFGKQAIERIYVKIPAEESNIWNVGARLKDPYPHEKELTNYNDLLLSLAAALVAFLFIEWLLQLRENM